MTPSKEAFTFHSYKKAQAFGFLYTKEVFALQVLAWSLSDNPVIVNIGSGAGTSGLAFREAQPNADITTVDISAGGPHGGLENERNAFAGIGLKLNTHILGDSKLIGKDWEKLIDLLFIDGDHSVAGCRGDLEAWYPHVKKNGLIAIHDYDSANWGDVKMVTDSFAIEKNLYFLLQVDTVIVFRKI